MALCMNGTRTPKQFTYAQYIKLVAVASSCVAIFTLFIDIKAVLDLTITPFYYEDRGMQTSVLCALMALASHLLLTMMHIAEDFMLIKTVDWAHHSYVVKFHKKTMLSLCIECLNLLQLAVLSPDISYIIISVNVNIVMHLYMLWPIRIYMRIIRSVN